VGSRKAQFILDLDPTKLVEAEPCLLKAIEVARHQGAKSLELRAATSLAELWRRHEKFDQARDLLEPVYRWFDEGSDTGDLRRARDVLIGLTDQGSFG
jgi:predicted ATPase